MKGGRWGTVELADIMLKKAMNSARGSKFDSYTMPSSESLLLNHLAHPVRRLDYGKEILGGEWRLSSKLLGDQEVATDVDTVDGYQMSGNTDAWSGLSSMLHIEDKNASQHTIVLDKEVDPGYRSCMVLLCFLFTERFVSEMFLIE